MRKIKNYLKNLLSRYYCNTKEYNNLQQLDNETHDEIFKNSNRFWAITVVFRSYYQYKEKENPIAVFLAFLLYVSYF